MITGRDKPSVSIVICTFNRRLVLADTLQSLCGVLVPPGLAWELLVVDNNSTDGTCEQAMSFRGRLPIRCSREPRQGKTFALNRAVREAEGDLLLFTDDDVRIDPGWLEAYVRAAADYPDAGWFGGCVCPQWEGERPEWLHDDCVPALSGYFVMYDLGDQERLYSVQDNPPIGANMAVRHSTFAMVGYYREDLGPRGNQRGTSDDTELVLRAAASGIPGLYVPQARCAHLVAQERLALVSFFRYGVIKGADQTRMEGGTGPRGSLVRVFSQAARAMPQALRGRWDRVRICCLNIGLEFGRRRATREMGL